LSKFLNALGIRFVGKESSDILAQNFSDIEKLKIATYEDLYAIEGIGDKMAQNIVEYFSNNENLQMIDEMIALGVKISNKYNGVLESPMALNMEARILYINKNGSPAK